jgi:hypothetical protein
MRRHLYIMAVLLPLLALPLMAPTCGGDDDDSTTTPVAPPEDVAKVVKTGMELAITSIDFAEQIATLDNPPQFNPCMVATGSKAGLQMGIANVPNIEAEALNPDGKLDITGGPISFKRCMGMDGKPDPWPPTTPDPNVEQMIKAGVPLAIGVAKTFIEPKIPDTGKECIEGRVAMAMMDSIGEVVTTTVIDGVNGADVTSIPNFQVNYSGCGLDFSDTPKDPAPEGDGT